MNLTELINDYWKEIASIKENRKQIKYYTDQNRPHRKKLNAIKKQIIVLVNDEMEKGKNLYAIAKDSFGKIDKRFHVLFTLIKK